MKILRLKLSEQFYETLSAMLKGLPKEEVEIIEQPQTEKVKEDEPFDINQFAGTIDWPVDGLQYQKKMRAEWDREWG